MTDLHPALAALRRVVHILAAAALPVVGAPDFAAGAIDDEPKVTIAAARDSHGFGIDDVVFSLARSGPRRRADRAGDAGPGRALSRRGPARPDGRLRRRRGRGGAAHPGRGVRRPGDRERFAPRDPGRRRRLPGRAPADRRHAHGGEGIRRSPSARTGRSTASGRRTDRSSSPSSPAPRTACQGPATRSPSRSPRTGHRRRRRSPSRPATSSPKAGPGGRARPSPSPCPRTAAGSM